MTGSIDIFSIHRKVMEDYKHFVRSFIHIRDERIKNVVESEIEKGRFWPEPLIQFNPSFEPGESVEFLCEQGILHPEMKKVFKNYQLFRHQAEAIKKGAAGFDFIVTSGTGSGKSLTFLGTIFNHLFTHGTGNGVKAVIVYPMNALINSQYKEIDRYRAFYEQETGKPFPITFAQYTGQEDRAEKEKIRETLPDIILTNYMMLELILTRSQEDRIRNSIFASLEFLAFDELHTYRGRQGSDVAVLIRRIKAQTARKIVCIGTSATMASRGTISERKRKVAEAAAAIFGAEFSEDRIINEYLKKCFDDAPVPDAETLKSVLIPEIEIEAPEPELKTHPLSIWLENKIALDQQDEFLIRNRPMSLSHIVDQLSDDSGCEKNLCKTRLKDYLRWLSNVNERIENKRNTYLPYKIHQLISQTGTVRMSLDGNVIRLNPEMYANQGENKIPLFPVMFSRISGHEFMCVNRDDDQKRLFPREFREIVEDEEDNQSSGYIITGEDIWNSATDMELLPDAWTQPDKSGNKRVIKKYRDRIPAPVFYDSKGNFSTEAGSGYEFEGWYMPAKLLFDPTCGAIYDPKTSEGTKLTRLGSEGRSTSTTILSYAILEQLAAHGFGDADQKLLSFTDNRQDAALQSGHFNDTINVIRLRSAIYHALAKRGDLEFYNLDQAILDVLNLTPEDYAANPSSRFPSAVRDNETALKNYLMYKALHDLRRSWRVILPNLEQCALLTINYKHLETNCAADENWEHIPFINALSHEERAEIIRRTLDYFRKAYALHSDEYLSENAIAEKEKIIRERLKAPWKFDDQESVERPYKMSIETLKKGTRIYSVSAGPASALGKYLRAEAKNRGVDLNAAAYVEFIGMFFELLAEAGWLEPSRAKNKENQDTTLYQLRVDQIIWKKGDETTVPRDDVRIRAYKEYEQQPNMFYQRLYKTDFTRKKRLAGYEHTGQLSNNDRIEREEKFRSGEYSALFCSPTMELGIDIKELNVVHMRNVPPNPANYAQRGGRAGRSGQAALVFTNCSAYSPHDMHYFKHAGDLVSGVVAPPKIDLKNRELLESHLNAVYLSVVNLHELNQSIPDLLSDEDPENLPLKPEVRANLNTGKKSKNKIKTIFEKVVEDISRNEKIFWLDGGWLDRAIDSAPVKFDRALDRWRRMYVAVQNQIKEANRIIESGIYPNGSDEMKEARRNVGQAIRQRELLTNRTNLGAVSEFYPYRYLAAEGFLPGYNFTRLPVRTFIPIGDAGEYISRSRFIALREFGPGNVIYHKSSKYRIDQILIRDAELNLQKAKVSLNSGYLLTDHEYNNEICPFSHVLLSGGNDKEIYLNLLEMSETKTRRIERISCEEEERMARGFDIRTYFSMPGGRLDAIRKAAVKNDDDAFLYVKFLPSARLTQINRKWRRSKAEGFLMGLKSGKWKKESQNNESVASTEETHRVQLTTHDTADALYIEPIKALGLTPEGVITLQYAFKRAVENVFQIESNEIGAELMGHDEHPNIFLYEAAEGSLGILSQFVEDQSVFLQVVKEAYSICRFEDENYKDEASYADLLSYYNQRYHDVINRFEIKKALETLLLCRVEIISNSKYTDYEAHYRMLLERIDPNSETELKFLKYLYKNNLRLPDACQKETPGVYCKPDFFYEPDFWVFCDGKPHDRPDVKTKDREQRNAILNRGDQVFVYYYKDDPALKIAERSDVFKKVK